MCFQGRKPSATKLNRTDTTLDLSQEAKEAGGEKEEEEELGEEDCIYRQILNSISHARRGRRRRVSIANRPANGT